MTKINLDYFLAVFKWYCTIMAIDGLKSFGFDKLLLIVYMHIHYVHFYDISAIHCNTRIDSKLIFVMNIK